MRKLVLALPMAALLLAAGIVLSEFGQSFAEPAPRTSSPDASPKANPAGEGWQETGGGGSKSGA